MSLKEKLNDVLKTVGLKATEVELAQMKLEDGMTVIEADSFDPEMSVMIVTENGNVPLPVGEYTLEDGRVLVVEQEGIIKEIKDAMTEEEAPDNVPAEAETTEMEEQAPSAKKIVESIIKESFFSEMEALKKENTELKAQLETLKLSEVETVEETVIEEPIAEPIAINPEQPATEMKYKVGKGSSTINTVLNFINK